MSRGKKLTRQIGRYLGLENAGQELADLLADPAKSAALPEVVRKALGDFSGFLDIVEESYKKYEENIAIAERNIQLSSKELVEADHAINAMVNSLGQGFLIFGRDGICAPVYSYACQMLLETVPAGKHIAEVLRLTEAEKATLTSLIRLVFDRRHAMNFDEIMRLAPRSFRHSGGRHIQIDYKCPPRPDGAVEEIVVTATDITDQIRAQNLAEEQQAMFLSIERVLHDRRMFGAMIRHLRDITALPPAALRKPENMREIHTLKSSAGIFKLTRLTRILHELESALRAASPAAEAQLTGDLAKEIAALVSRFNALLGTDVTRLETIRSPDQDALRAFAVYLAAHGHAEVRQEFLYRICAESLSLILRNYDMMLEDLAATFGKKIEPLRFVGVDIFLVPDHYAEFLRALSHLFRNIIIHGIEVPKDRVRRNKPEAGRITVVFVFETKGAGPVLRLTISDDGGGIDPARLRAKLVAENPGDDWKQRPDSEVLDQIFNLGFSTSAEVTPVAGRGIGMNAVRYEVEKLGGTISVTSTLGKGTDFHIAVPFVLDF